MQLPRDNAQPRTWAWPERWRRAGIWLQPCRWTAYGPRTKSEVAWAVEESGTEAQQVPGQCAQTYNAILPRRFPDMTTHLIEPDDEPQQTQKHKPRQHLPKQRDAQ